MNQSRESPHDGHRGRLRERFLSAGASAFSDHELLELLLTYAIPRRDVKPIAKRLLQEFGDLAAVMGAPAESLRAVAGLGPASVALIRLASVLTAEASRPERLKKRKTAGSPEEALAAIRGYTIGKREEEIHALLLDNRNQVSGHELVVSGTVDQAVVFPRKILEVALARRASGLILVHNHPSGDPEPSRADVELTKGIARASAAIGLRFVDHIILGSASQYSFQAQNPSALEA